MRSRLIGSALGVAVLVVALTAGSCETTDDSKGIGDAPSTQVPDKERLIWPNADGFPNVSAFCTGVGGNGIYTTTGAQRPPSIVVDDPQCDEGGDLLPPD